ncbi:unnamed protein product [Cochlearia groenlandica]
MGRRKLEIKRIESKSSRQVSFCKRRNGLMEKARQLSILCESSVAIVIVSSTGKLYTSSSGDSMAKILKRYEIQHDDELKSLDLKKKTQNYISHKELLEIVQCKLEEVKNGSISTDSLISLEEQLKTALSLTRTKKTELLTELVNTLQEKEKRLRKHNQFLARQLTKIEKKRLLETEDVRPMRRPNSFVGKNTPKTLPLLK